MSNYPAGVTDNDIPGNSPEDVAEDAYYVQAEKELDKNKLGDAIYCAIEEACNGGEGYRQFRDRAQLRQAVAALVDRLHGDAPIDLAADLGECGVEPLAEVGR